MLSVDDEFLNKETWLDVGFGEVVMTVHYHRGLPLKRTYTNGLSDQDDECTKVKDLEDVFSNQFRKAKRVTLFFNAPLWDALYEWEHEKGEWILKANGRGFA
ncbi:hypothetical protein [Paenibacillus xylanexedens]|uniref:hypothetical protein n=1 Tax=Paenibacillus xylanexedens TaxID=528191 RepID=UPI001B3AAE46|nr:hypothetical protein [Paenibacillus xylanexedens]